MKPTQIEYWALEILERVKKRERIEDSRVELKSEWPSDFARAARQLAGHANASRGEPVLWLIGVDEKKGLIVGAPAQELSNWNSSIGSHFDARTSPTLLGDRNVAFDGQTVSALVFETDSAPYVIRNPAFGITKGVVEFEVPWREGTSTRSATRNDLLKILVPLQDLPEIEPLSGEINIYFGSSGWRVSLEIYILPGDGELVIPFHRCSMSIVAAGQVLESDLHILGKPREYLGEMKSANKFTNSELFVREPGRFILEGMSQDRFNASWSPPEQLEVKGILYDARGKLSTSFSCQPFSLIRKDSNGVEWRFKAPR